MAKREQRSMYCQLVLGMKVIRIKVPLLSSLKMGLLLLNAIIIAVQKKTGKHYGRNLNQIGLHQSYKEESKKESQADILIRVSEEAEFFQSDLGEAYAAVTLNGHKEVLKVKNKKFKMWLTKQYYDATKRAPGSDAMNQALGVMEMKAAFDGDEHRLQLRVAEKDDAFYYDLANEDWSVVKIEPNVCQVLNEPPILFTRNKNTKSQALPDFAGDLKNY